MKGNIQGKFLLRICYNVSLETTFFKHKFISVMLLLTYMELLQSIGILKFDVKKEWIKEYHIKGNTKNLCDMVKHELRVESLKTRVESLKARVEIRK